MMKYWLLLGFVLVSLVCDAQKRETLKPRAISKLLPAKIDGYKLERDSRSSILTIGTLRYSLCERIFSDGDRRIKILLFDYAEAPVMLNQSVKKWGEMSDINNDSVTFTSGRNSYGKQWESSHPRSQRSQLLLSINKRFFLTLEADNVSMEALKEFADRNIDLAKFPE